MSEAKRSRDGLAKAYRILITKEKEKKERERARQKKREKSIGDSFKEYRSIEIPYRVIFDINYFRVHKIFIINSSYTKYNRTYCARKERKKKKRGKKEGKNDTCLGAVRGI